MSETLRQKFKYLENEKSLNMLMRAYSLNKNKLLQIKQEAAF